MMTSNQSAQTVESEERNQILLKDEPIEENNSKEYVDEARYDTQSMPFMKKRKNGETVKIKKQLSDRDAFLKRGLRPHT